MAADGSVIIQIDGEDSGFKKTLNGLKGIAGGAVKGIAGTLAGVTASLGAAGAAALKFGAEYESSVAKVATIADTSVKSIDALSSEIMELSNRTGAAASDLNEALYSAISAGADTAHATELVETAVKAARGGFTDTETAVDGLTSALNAYGMATTEANGLANKFLVTQNLGKTTFGELAGSIGQVAPTANAAGVSIDDLLASVASLTANGIGTSEAMTGIKAALSNIIKPTSDASKMAQRLGIDFSTAGLQAKGWAGFLQEVQQKTGGSTEKMAALFGSVEALNTVLTLTSDQGMALMDRTLQEMAVNTTALDDAYNTMSQTLGTTVQTIGTNLQNLGIELYNSVDGPLNDIAESALGMVRGLQDAFENGGLDGLVAQIGSSLASAVTGMAQYAPQIITAAMSLLMSFAQGIYNNLPQILAAAGQIVQTLGTAIITAAPQMLNAALSMMQSLAAGIASNLPALIPAALSILTEISAGLRSGVGQLVDGALAIIQAIGRGIIQSLPALIESVPLIVTNIAGIINDNAPKLVATAASLIGQLAVGLVNAIPTLVDNIPQIIEAIVSVFMAFNWLDLGKTIITMFKNGITAMVGAVKGAAGNVLNAINNTLKNLPSTLLNLGKQGIQGLINGIKGLLGSVLDTISAVAQAIVNGAIKLPGELLNIGKQIIQGLINGIKSGISGVVSAIGGMVSSAVDKAKSLLGIHSPSRVFRDQVGLMISRGMALGISKGEREVLDVADRLNEKLLKKEEQLNERIAAMEQEARDRQAAAELADYRQKLADKYDELGKAEILERQKIQDEIAQMEAEWNEKQLEAQRDAEQERLEAQLDTLQKFQEEYENALSDIQNAQESMSDKLRDYGDLFTTVKGEAGGSFIELGDLQADIDAINRYGDALEQLKARGVSDSLMNEITSMSVDEATAYTERLLGMTDDQYTQYMSLWEQKQQAAKQVASQFYKDEMDALGREFVDKIPEELGGVKDEMRTIGVNGIQGMIDGMYSRSGALYSAAASIVSQAIAAMRAAADIHSPSKKSAELVGAPLAQGVGVGFEQAYPSVMQRLRTAFDASMAQTSARLQGMADMRGGGVIREVTNNNTTVDRVIRIDVTGSDGEFVRWLRKKIKAEDDRTGPALA